MVRLLVWLAGSVSLLWLAYHFGVWRVLVSMTIAACAFLWIIFGGYLIARNWRKEAPPPPPMSPEDMLLHMAAARKGYAAQYGETGAKFAEGANPQIWANMVQGRWAGK
jgi:hypothetical protein